MELVTVKERGKYECVCVYVVTAGLRAFYTVELIWSTELHKLYITSSNEFFCTVKSHFSHKFCVAFRLHARIVATNYRSVSVSQLSIN